MAQLLTSLSFVSFSGEEIKSGGWWTHEEVIEERLAKIHAPESAFERRFSHLVKETEELGFGNESSSEAA